MASCGVRGREAMAARTVRTLPTNPCHSPTPAPPQAQLEAQQQKVETALNARRHMGELHAGPGAQLGALGARILPESLQTCRCVMFSYSGAQLGVLCALGAARCA